MEFRILGPLEVADGERTVPVGRGKQRALLALLLLHRNAVVSRDRLIDELWGERPTDTAATALHGLVSQLRKGFDSGGENGLVRTQPPGYLLAVDPAHVDADRFEQAVAEGSAALEAGNANRAAATLRRGLALWRGPALADLTHERFAAPEIARLEQLRLTAVEQLFDAELARGRHAAVIPELEEFVARHPHRERSRGQLMLALYRAQRQSDALGLYQDTYRVLRDDLGVAPGPELRRLHAAILRHDRGLAGPPTRPFVGSRPRRLGLPLLAVVLLAAAAIWGAAQRTSASARVGPNSVAVVDAAGDSVEAVELRATPAALAAGSEAVWTVAYGDEAVLARIDARSRVLRRTIVLGEDAPTDVAFGAGSAWIATAPRHRARRSPLELGGVAHGLPRRLEPRSRRTTAWRRPGAQPQPQRRVHGGHARRADRHARTGLVRLPNSLMARIAVDGGRLREVDYRALGPAGIASGAGSIWIANAGDESVARLDSTTGKVIDEVAVEQRPAGVAVGRGAVWVANYGSDTVSRIPVPPAGGRLAVSSTIEVGDGPTAVAVGAGAVWVANADGTLSRIDPATESVKSVKLGDVRPVDVVVAGQSVWVAVAERRAGG